VTISDRRSNLILNVFHSRKHLFANICTTK